MPSSTTAKSQPWRSEWPATDLPNRDDQSKSEHTQGTSHGFKKGEMVILDGNAGSNSHAVWMTKHEKDAKVTVSR